MTPFRDASAEPGEPLPTLRATNAQGEVHATAWAVLSCVGTHQDTRRVSLGVHDRRRRLGCALTHEDGDTTVGVETERLCVVLPPLVRLDTA